MRELVEHVHMVIEQTFGWSTAVSEVHDVGFAYDSVRRQYAARELLDLVVAQAEPAHVRALGFTDLDLFIPQLNFVFGLARIGGCGAIVSTHRLKPEFYGYSSDILLLISRTKKEVVHELGHTLGLQHCANRRCVMSFSNHIGEVDAKGERFCPRCRKLVDAALARL